MIRQKGKKIVKMVRVIEDAEPRHVSLVDNGANQTPFRQLKSAVPTDTVEAAKQEIDMADKETTVKSGAALVRVTFASDKFQTEEAVRKWMTEKGYDENATVAKTDGGFEALDPSFKKDEGADVRIVEAEAGVSYHLLGDDDEGAEDDEEGEAEDEAEGEDAAKSVTADLEAERKELSAKLSDMRVYFSDKTKMSEVMKDADDGMPIGAGETFQVFYKALTNAASAGDIDAVKSIAGEFGEVFTTLMKTTASLIGEAASDEAKSVTADEGKQDSAKADEVVEDKSNADAIEDGAEEEAEVVVEDTSVLNAIKEMQEALGKVLGNVESTLSEASKKTDETITSLKSQVEAMTNKVKELESVEQSRKGADEDVSRQKVPEKKGLSKLDQNTLGI